MNHFDHHQGSNNFGDAELPHSCDVKEQLIAKLEELDNKIYQLMKSNRIIEEDMKDDADYKYYIKENNEIIIRSKDEIWRILTAFIKAAMNLDKDVYPKLKYRNLYMGEDGKMKENEKETQN